MRIPIETFQLDNGLLVTLSEDHTAPIVAGNLWYHVGSANERSGRTGFAHLFEHMLFQGSANVAANEHFELVQRAGGTLNGSTWLDRTNYFETLPSNQLALALWLPRYLIGVYGFDGDSFLQRLREANVRLLLDVRQRRGVRGPEYAWANSLRLQAALAHAGSATSTTSNSLQPRSCASSSTPRMTAKASAVRKAW